MTGICSKLPGNNVIKSNPGVQVLNIDKTRLNNLYVLTGKCYTKMSKTSLPVGRQFILI
jgi:hypothetical protein